METKKKAIFIYGLTKSEEDIMEGWLIIRDNKKKKKEGERPKWWSPDQLPRYCANCQIIQWLILVTSQSDIYGVAIV